MSPKATLLGQPWETRTMVFGKRRIVFQGDQPREVPVAIALVLGKRKKADGKPLFRIDELPEIVKAKESAVIQKPVEAPKQSMRNETRKPSQRKLEGWA